MSQQQDIFDIDFSTVPDSYGLNLPAGTYEMNVASVKTETDVKDGETRTYLNCQFKVAEGQFEGSSTFERIYLPKAQFKLKQLLGALGYDVTTRIDVRQLIATDALLGKPVKIVLIEGTPAREGRSALTNVGSFEKSERQAAAGQVSGGQTTGGLPGMPGM
ncbi:hypothetical protein D3C78_18570 [compost metagenome]